LTSIGETYDPFDMRCFLLDKLNANRYCSRFAILRKKIAESHSIKLNELIPFRSLYKSDQFAFIGARAVAHDTSKDSIQKNAEVKLTIIHNLSRIMMFFHEFVSRFTIENFKLKILCTHLDNFDLKIIQLFLRERFSFD
jgi:NurA-like 5'-3' nuclease